MEAQDFGNGCINSELNRAEIEHSISSVVTEGV